MWILERKLSQNDCQKTKNSKFIQNVEIQLHMQWIINVTTCDSINLETLIKFDHISMIVKDRWD